MKVVMVSCWAYRDAWGAYMALFRRFWKDCPYTLIIATDECGTDYDFRYVVPDSEIQAYGKGKSWCEIVSQVAANVDDNLLLMQEDFFLNQTVKQDLVVEALAHLVYRKAGMVRLYPCPGAEGDSINAHYGIVPRGTQYRTSCQASIWNPLYLYAIANGLESPADFEIEGTKRSESLPNEVLAFKREVEPWPMEYLCSAISRGKWNPDAKKLCDYYDIAVDWSLREFAPA